METAGQVKAETCANGAGELAQGCSASLDLSLDGFVIMKNLLRSVTYFDFNNLTNTILELPGNSGFPIPAEF